MSLWSNLLSAAGSVAEYIRYEIYVPTLYTTERINQATGSPFNETHELDNRLLQQFIQATLANFEGITQANPASVAPYKGWWQPRNTAESIESEKADQSRKGIAVDYLTYLFGLVRIDRHDEAHQHFTDWKSRFEESLQQDVVLVTYHPVRTIGDFF